MKKISNKLRQYFSDDAEFQKANLPVVMLLTRFPDSEIRLKTSKSTIFVGKTDLEECEPPIQTLEDIDKPTHAERVMNYFYEKEKEADAILKEASIELKKLGKEDLIKRLKTAVSFYQSGDWIDDDGLRKE